MIRPSTLALDPSPPRGPGRAPDPTEVILGPGSRVLRGFASAEDRALLAELEGVTAASPFRNMETPGKSRMTVAMTNCGELGWVTDRGGIRYEPQDPSTGAPWPRIPPSFLRVATAAAARVGFEGFIPDACLINRYQIGARLTLHQDRDERDHLQPIVSISLGMPAVFLFGGLARTDLPREIPVTHGDVVVWGGPDRLRYHGVLPIRPMRNAPMGRTRINITFRKAG